MGDLRNKARKQAQEQALRDAQDLLQHGFTVFHFDFNPKLTRRNLALGEAIRHLMRVTGARISFWRCPVRGLAIQYRKLPLTSMAHDRGETYVVLRFCDLLNEVEAKRVLVLDMLLRGIDLYCGLPNKGFDDLVGSVKWLLTAPPSVSAEEWLKVRAKLDPKVQAVLRTHEAELRFHILGEKYTGPNGPVALTVQGRMAAIDRRA